MLSVWLGMICALSAILPRADSSAKIKLSVHSYWTPELRYRTTGSLFRLCFNALIGHPSEPRPFCITLEASRAPLYHYTYRVKYLGKSRLFLKPLGNGYDSRSDSNGRQRAEPTFTEHYIDVKPGTHEYSLGTKAGHRLKYSISAKCEEHYYGRYCKKYCRSTRHDHRRSYTCDEDGSVVCADHYYGPRCDIYCRPQDNERRGHYTCSSQGRRICRSGYTGPRCKSTIEACNPDPCVNGKCQPSSDKGKDFGCVCDPGYTGEVCESSACAENPCVNGNCSISAGGTDPVCTCTPGFTGRRCDIQDMCSINLCMNGGTCERTETRPWFQCSCHSGFGGLFCQTPTVATTTSCEPNPCVNGTCSLSPDGAGFTCSCTTGFTGDFCNVSQCAQNVCVNGVCSLDVDGTGSVCACNTGFIGDSCNIPSCDPNPCANGNCSLNGDNENGFVCDCRPGFTGELCNIPVCLPNPCVNGVCSLDAPGPDFSCACNPGFIGHLCNVPTCDPDPCINGVCSVNADQSGLTCTCDRGFIGDLCNTPTCSTEPCDNGVCSINGAGTDFICTCNTGFMGRLCDVRDPCSINTCLNGGSCMRVGAPTPNCICPPMFTGLFCEQPFLFNFVNRTNETSELRPNFTTF